MNNNNRISRKNFTGLSTLLHNFLFKLKAMEKRKESGKIEIGDLHSIDSKLEKKAVNDIKARKMSSQKLEGQQIEYFRILDPTAESRLLQHFNFATCLEKTQEKGVRKSARQKKSKSRKIISPLAASLGISKKAEVDFDDVIVEKVEEHLQNPAKVNSKSRIFYQPRSLSVRSKLMSEKASRRRRKMLSNLQYLNLQTRAHEASDSFASRSISTSNKSDLKRPVSVTRTTSSGDAITETYVFLSRDTLQKNGQIFSEGSKCNDDERKIVENIKPNKG